ncbi:MAG: hypothetical protein H8E37_05160 [Planctomycetes bacterium]|nr:hypothetical protein [Planctomycetota bacterium]
MIRSFAAIVVLAVVSGCGGVKPPEPTPDSTAGETTPAAGQTVPAESGQPPAAPKQVTFGKTKARLVDYAEATQDPKVIEVENKINASDPLTASYQSYFSIGSRAMILAFKHNLNLQKELNGGSWPSFEQFSADIKKMNVELVPILPWQMFAYNQQNGSIVLLEDKGDKIKRYKAKDIPLDDDDKPFDTE